MLHPLTLENVALIDGGRIKLAVDLHLKKLLDDCLDRPGTETSRELTLKLAVKPCLDPDTGECDDVDIEFEIGSKVPKHRSKPVNCTVRKSTRGTMALFNDLSEDNAQQKTIDEVE